MAYHSQFLNISNFELAFRRLVRAQNDNYKVYYRHFFDSYQLSLKENLFDLIEDIKQRTYEPGKPLTVYLPKENGLLRPITILSLRDLIVYHAIMNYVARRIEPLQRKHALTKAFGALLSGREASALFLDWRKCYREYHEAITRAFDQGNDHVADFDLVSFFELIDHSLLRRILAKYVSNDDTLDLLFKCLASWRRNRRDEPILHGILQGPEPSAFFGRMRSIPNRLLEVQRRRVPSLC